MCDVVQRAYPGQEFGVALNVARSLLRIHGKGRDGGHLGVEDEVAALGGLLLRRGFRDLPRSRSQVRIPGTAFQPVIKKMQIR